jgi:hypothetical protein
MVNDLRVYERLTAQKPPAYTAEQQKRVIAARRL